MIKSCLIGVLAITSFANANTDKNTLETILITGSSPLSKLSDTQSIIGQTQVLTSEQLHRLPSRSLAEIMRNQLVSVNINDVQNNPFQPDVQYRGFTASPLLGLPQGLSIYSNGTRVNEPFGDTVNWDLLPLEALENVLLFSTSNPIFGQNTLGGALVLNTKNGFSYEETAIDISVGQYGRKEWSLQSGMNQGNWGLDVLANQYQEDGWRDFSPSEVNQFFSTLSHHTSDSQIDLTWLHVDNELLGNGAIPEALLEFEPRSAVDTHPDQTNNELNFITLNINTSVNDSLNLIVNAFYRDNETQSINGDDSDYGACELAQGLITLCDLEVDGTYNTGRARNESRGMTAQLSQQFKLGSLPSQTIYGVGSIRAGINYQADSTFGILANDTVDDTRVVVPLTGLLDDEARVRLDVDTTATFAYVSNVTELSGAMTLNIAARYNRDHILMRDLIDQGEGSLSGDHRFTSFNPTIGVTYVISDLSSFNLSYAQATRVPSPAELSCADEDDPCRLPNGFVADPPLNKVVTRAIKGSFVGLLDTLSYNATVFHSQSVDDIIFQQASTTSSRGYFINIDKTQRLGVELSVSRQFDQWSTSASYNYLDATFESGFTSFSPVNRLGPNRQVSAGNTIPGQPQHQIKLRGVYHVSDSVNMGAQFLYASTQYYRGYDTFGTYGEADEVLEDIYPNIDSPYFIGVGHPRTVSINVQYRFNSAS